MIRVKVCGITREEDARAACAAGADAIGMVFAPSPRRIDVEQARRIAACVPPWVVKVGVFVDEAPEAVARVVREVGLQAVQLHGDEDAEYCARFAPNAIKAIRLRDAGDVSRIDAFSGCAILLDAWSAAARGGTGRTVDTALARRAAERTPWLILSGGLDPDNVTEAVRQVRPAMVDASSRLERAPGLKDAERVRAFVAAARRA